MDGLLSKEECQIIIKNAIKTDDENLLESFNIIPFKDENSGLLSDYFKLKINFIKIQGQLYSKSFFIKSIPLENASKREAISQVGFFKKEVFFFENLVSKLRKYSGSEKWSPECYFTRDDVLVFEDLKEDGYQVIPIKYECTSDQYIFEALKTLATFHASSFSFEYHELQSEGTTLDEKFKDIFYETGYFPQSPWFNSCSKAVKMIGLEYTKYGIGTKYERKIKTQFDEQILRIFDILEGKTVTKIPNVLCHRDTWRNNLMFKFDSESLNKPLDCLLIDFQICICLPPTIDVLNTILSFPGVKKYKEQKMYYLNFYYDQLKDRLSKNEIDVNQVFPWNDFLKNCDEVLLFALVNHAFFSILTHLPVGVLDKIIQDDPKSFVKIMTEDKNELVREFMEKDEFYKEALTEIVEQLIECMFNI